MLVNLPVAGEGFAAFFVAAEDSYEVGIFYLFVKIPDEASAGQVGGGNFIEWTDFFLAGGRVEYHYRAGKVCLQEHL